MRVIGEALDLLTELAVACKLETLDSSDGVELRETLDVKSLPLLLLPKSGKSTGPSVP